MVQSQHSFFIRRWMGRYNLLNSKLSKRQGATHASSTRQTSPPNDAFFFFFFFHADFASMTTRPRSKAVDILLPLPGVDVTRAPQQTHTLPPHPCRPSLKTCAAHLSLNPPQQSKAVPYRCHVHRVCARINDHGNAIVLRAVQPCRLHSSTVGRYAVHIAPTKHNDRALDATSHAAPCHNTFVVHRLGRTPLFASRRSKNHRGRPAKKDIDHCAPKKCPVTVKTRGQCTVHNQFGKKLRYGRTK